MDSNTYHFRGSELQRLELCPGSSKAASCMKDTTSLVAESGSTIHAALDAVITLDSLASLEAIDDAVEAYKGKLSTREAFILSWFARIVQKSVADRGGALELSKEESSVIEFKTDDGKTVQVSGTPDLIVKTAQGTDVFEYKTGSAEVETADKHVQGQLYVLIGARRFPAESVRLHIVAAGNEKGENHTFADYGPDACGFCADRIQSIVMYAVQEDAPRIVSLAACRYCKAAGTIRCKESSHAVEKFGQNIIKMDDPVAVFMALDPEARAATIDRAVLVKRVLEKILAAAKDALAVDPCFIPGYAVGAESKTKSIDDAKATFKVLSEKAGITPDEFSGIVSVSLGDVKRLYVDHVQAEQKAQGAKPSKKKDLELEALTLLAPVIVEGKKKGSLEKI